MATPPLRKVVLIGASGIVGSYILDALLADPADHFQITILSRKDSKAAFLPHASITVAKTDFTIPDLLPHLKGQDAIIHAAGLASLSTEPLIIQAAIQAEVPRFILNEFANSPTNQVGLPELECYRTPKKEVMALAERMASEHPSFGWTALSTGNFIDYSLKRFPQFGMDIKNRTARLVDDGMERFSAVTLADIGVAVRGILRKPDETRSRICHIRSVETCQVEILEALREEVGSRGWEVKYEDSKVMYERGKEAFSKGEVSGRMDLLIVQLFAKGGGRSVVVKKRESDNDLLGVVEKDIMTVVKEVLRTFDQVSKAFKE